MVRFEIVATSVTFEQENLTSPTKLSFRTIQRVTIEGGTSLSYISSESQLVIWRDYLIGSYDKAQPKTHGLFLWSIRENSVFFFEVCHSFFLSQGALNPNSRQMEIIPRYNKVIDDLLFITIDILDGAHWNTTYRCIHMPSLVNSTQLPGGSLYLKENAFAVLLPKCIMESRTLRLRSSARTTIYSVPTCLPTHPRYCFIIQRFPGEFWGVEWEVLEVEIDLSIPGPIKVFSRVSRQYTIQRPAYPLHYNDDDIFLYLPLGRGGLPRASLNVRFLRVGKPGKKGPVARLGGVDKMPLKWLSVDTNAGYVILWVADDRHSDRYCPFIWWLDERKSGNMVYSRTKKFITSLSPGLLQRF